MDARIAVLGAGPCGLMALKNLLEAGFTNIVCFEARPYTGGIWNCSDDALLSVVDNTVFNSSRYRSAISDYPFSDDTDDYPTWRQMWKYLEGYVEEFGLRRHMRLNSRVVKVERVEGKWVVTIAAGKGMDGEEEGRRQEKFDKVVVAVGTFYAPKTPKIEGIEKFGGTVIHAIEFNRHNFKDKRVLVVGLHASGADIAVALKKQGAQQVYASHKHGITMLRKFSDDGTTFDVAMNMRFIMVAFFLLSWVPHLYYWLMDTLLAMMSRKAYPNIPREWGFDSPPSVATTAPLVADDIYPLMESGFLKPVPGIASIPAANTIHLTNAPTLSDIDAIIFCTGYQSSAPFLAHDPSLDPYAKSSIPSLYRGAFPLHPDPSIRNSLAFMGHGYIAFPGFVQLELVAMAIAQVWRGTSSLPSSLEEMQSWHASWLCWRADLRRRYIDEKDPVTHYAGLMEMVEYLRWYDQAAGTDVLSRWGWGWKAWRFWWSDREVYGMCADGVLSPAAWRLFETGKRKAWNGAREQILLDNKTAKERARKRREKAKLEKELNKTK